MGDSKVVSVLVVSGTRARGNLMKWWAAKPGEAQDSRFPRATFSPGWSSLLQDFVEAETQAGPKGAGLIPRGTHPELLNAMA